MIEKHEVKVFLVNQKCDVCKEGYMTYTDVFFTTNVRRYEHRCNNSKCNFTTTYSTTFPHPEYEYVKENNNGN